MQKQRTTLKVAALLNNEGQLGWLPTNPRQWTKSDIDLTAQSLTNDPDFLEDRPLLVVPGPTAKSFIVFAGNLRLTAARQLKIKEVPGIIYTPENETDQMTIKRRSVLDNGSFGAWDYDALANEWDDLPLGDWGVPAWNTKPEELEPLDANDGDKEVEQSEEVEQMINEAVKKAAGEVLEQIEKLGGSVQFITPHTAKMDFIKFAYYHKAYQRYNSLAFHPQQIFTAGDSRGGVTDALDAVRDGRTKPERLRFVIGDDFTKIYAGSLPCGTRKMPLDFPADLALELINEFTPEGGRVLDPCAGWGGRIVGFLASHAGHYEGVDASPLQIAGDQLIYDTYADVAVQPSKTAKLNISPFEKFDAGAERFDFALTSPPYFDTEKYQGGEQSYDGKNGYEDWRDKFYQPLIKKVYDALKPGAVFCLQVGSQRYPLRDDGIRIAKQIGFTFVECRTTDMRNSFCGTEEEKGEVAIILKKQP